MREYKILHDNPHCYLIPIGESPPSHAIRFETPEKAHEYKLALGLGTHPDPQKSPQSYKVLSETYCQSPVYQVGEVRTEPEDYKAPGCCQSHCPGCSWTEEQIRLNKA